MFTTNCIKNEEKKTEAVELKTTVGTKGGEGNVDIEWHRVINIEKLNAIVERIMTQHWGMAACRCWVCLAGREAGCRPREEYSTCEHESEKKYGHVKVEQNRTSGTGEAEEKDGEE